MKRGLVILDAEEIPSTERGERVAALQRQLVADGIDLALVYGDVYRSDDIGYLTNLCIYWNEGILAIPAHGEPVFLTKLSPRVFPWMKRVSTLTDLRSGPNFGQHVAGLLVDRPAGVIGLVDSPLWPALLVDQVTSSAEGWSVRALGDVVRRLRLVPSAAELSLLRAASRLMSQSLDESVNAGLDVHAASSLLEREVRGTGFTDLFITSARAPDGVTYLEVTGQYRQGWPQLARALGDTGRPTPGGVDVALDAVIAAAHAGVTERELAAAAAPALSDSPEATSWSVRCVNQADMSTGGEVLGDVGDVAHPAGAVVGLTVEVLYPGGGRAVRAETVLLTPGGAELLTISDSDKRREVAR